ncbi:MAG: hypothetical protein ACRCTZ_04660 [Sarcina sp.]
MKKVSLEMSVYREVKNIFYDLKESGRVCYVALRILCKDDVELFATPETILYALNGESKKISTKDRKLIKEGLEDLQENNFIILNEISRNKYSINPNGIKIDSSDKALFFTIPICYINKISKQSNWIDLLNYYLFLCSTMNISSKVSFWNYEKIMEHCNVSKNTISNRNKKLEELEVLHIERIKGNANNGEIVNTSNNYSLPEDKENAKSMANEILKKKIKEYNRDNPKERPIFSIMMDDELICDEVKANNIYSEKSLPF